MSKKLYQYELNKVNPFLDQTAMHIEHGDKLIFLGNKNGDRIFNPETGEMKGHSVFAKRVKVDKAQFTKIYVNSLGSWFGLSKTGVRIFTYILSILKPNRDIFIMDYEECMDHTGYKSKKSIADGIKELIENDFIARGRNKYMYFINPTVFFNGDRLTFLEQIEVENIDKLPENGTKKLE